MTDAHVGQSSWITCSHLARHVLNEQAMGRLSILMGVVFLVACGGGVGGGGVGENGDECRSTSECGDELACAGVNDGPVCGIPPTEECRTDDDCPDDGSLCHAVFDPCSRDFVGSRCQAPCNDSTDCGEGFTCDAGHCAARSCDDGFACEAREECDPTRIASATPMFDQHHGCFAVECNSDDVCGERFCVNGICQDQVGACVVPMAVP
jgi:hypothetical protein